MTRAEHAHRTPGQLAALLIDASTEAIGAAGGHSGGVYLRSGTPGLLRLAVLAGLPGPLFRPWWRLHVDRPFPVADAYRLGVQVVLPNATETMRRYPQRPCGWPWRSSAPLPPALAAVRWPGSPTVSPRRPGTPPTAPTTSPCSSPRAVRHTGTSGETVPRP